MRISVGIWRGAVTAMLSVAPTGCRDPLAYDNLTQPDIERVFATASAIEETIGTRFRSCHNSVSVGSGTHVHGLAVSAEGAGGGTNMFNLVPRPSVPNGFGANAPADYAPLGTNARLAANVVTALDRLVANGGTLGTRAQDLRSRAFGMFGVGCHLGYLALAYDSAAITTPGIALDSVPPLSGAADVMRAAIGMLDSAIAIASDPAVLQTGGFPLLSSWAGGNALTRDDFVRVVRSLRARFRAGVARTAAQRESVDWPAVIADADNGVSATFMIAVGGTTGWNNTYALGGRNLQLWYYGMADVSGAYDAWLSTPLALRPPFLIVSPDRRFPQGVTRSAQQAAGSAAGTSPTATPYVINVTEEPNGYPWSISTYQIRRFQYITTAGNTGAWPYITRAELDLLAAEGNLRAGNVPAAAARIDRTRVPQGGLPALAGVIKSLTQPVPGGSACVPRVPRPPAFTSTECGTIWEALKWEKRLESAYTGFSQWYFDSRGWGDLIEGAPLEFPVPWTELAARHRPFYSLGGPFSGAAPRGTYGF